MPVLWKVCAARGPEQNQESKQFDTVVSSAALTSFCRCSFMDILEGNCLSCGYRDTIME
jgi:hypothetical protein